jgi:hypothetical protein
VTPTTPEALAGERWPQATRLASKRMQTRYLLIASVVVALVILAAGALWLLRILS